MASGHVNRIKRPNTWLHRPMLQNVKKALANSEPCIQRSARCPLFGRYEGKSGRRGHRVFVDTEVIRGGPLLEVAGHGREAWRAAAGPRGCCGRHFFPAPIRERCYCVRNLYAAIRATMLAKISSAERDFRIIGLVEWRAADRPG
jgi:hypothetical protein